MSRVSVMNDLSRMIDSMKRADAEANPIKSIEILMGWRCSTCAAEFQPDPKAQPELAVRFTLGLPILCPKCSRPKEAQP